MTGKLPVVLTAGVFLAASAVAAEGAPRELSVTKELRRGASVLVDPLALTRSTIYELKAGENRVLLRVTPDGFLQFIETSAPVTVMVRGTRKNRVSFELEEGELVSVWPVVTIKISSDASDRIILEASSPGWAFVVRAEKVRQGGLPALVDGNPATLQKGQRLDADMKDKRVVFRLTRQTWPGTAVTMRAIAEEVREPAVPTIVVVAEPSLPGVLLDRQRDFPWQTIPLPVIAWEVFRPPDVSP